MIIPENKTKIIATLGPSCTPEVIREMIIRGADTFRLNFSHTTHDQATTFIEVVRNLNEELNTNCGILADLQGPKLRTGEVPGGSKAIVEGEDLLLTTNMDNTDEDKIIVNFAEFARDVKPGEHVLLDDGKVELEVIETDSKTEVKVKVVYGVSISSRKGVNLPQTSTSLPCLTEKDRADLDFILTQKVNWVALSFVRSADDIKELKEIIERSGRFMKVIAKIEKPEAITEIDAIIEETDAIMIARGDLGVEIPFDALPAQQKSIVNKCIQKAKPVIIATQIMESMINNPRPTRAEVSDVANAVFDGADCVMLSNETAVGKYPVRVIETITSILTRTEKEDIIYNKDLQADKSSSTYLSDAICYDACRVADSVNAKALVGMTASGYTGFLLSSFRPKARVFIFTHNPELLNTLSLTWGTRGFYYDSSESTDQTIADVNKILQEKGLVEKGDIIINTASMPLKDRGRANMLKVTKLD